jgi:hypothetical protein
MRKGSIAESASGHGDSASATRDAAMIASRTDWLGPTPDASYPFTIGGFIAAAAHNNDRNARGPHDRASD